MAGRGFRERRFTTGGANAAHHHTSLARTAHPEGRRRHRRTAAGLAELRDQQLTPPPLLPPVRVRKKWGSPVDIDTRQWSFAASTKKLRGFFFACRSKWPHQGRQKRHRPQLDQDFGLAHVRTNGDPLRPLLRPCFLLHSGASYFAFARDSSRPHRSLSGKSRLLTVLLSHSLPPRDA